MVSIGEAMSFQPDAAPDGGGGAEGRLCAACLTRGRRMYRVADLADVLTLLASTATALLDPEAASAVEVCWECYFLLRRISKFRTQVVSVSILLQSMDMMGDYKRSDYSLSPLKRLRKVGEDYVAQHGGRLRRSGAVQLVGHPVAAAAAFDTKSEPRSGDEQWDPGEAAPRRSGRALRRTLKMEEIDDGDEEPPKKRPRKTKADRSAKKVRPERVKGEKVIAIEMTEAEMQRARDEMRAGRAYSGSVFRCETCIAGFASGDALDRHHAARHSDAAGTYRCDVCSCRAASEEALAAHRKLHYTLYACLCGFTLRSLHAVVRHYRAQHAPHDKYACKTCGKEFLTDRALRYHRECQHKEAQKCEYCGKLFNNGSTFKRHLLQHTGMPMYECPVCHKSYRGTFGLRAHQRTHAPAAGGAAPEDAFCAECNVQFKNKYLYRHHLRTSPRHAAPENFRFPCQRCGKRFFVRSQLKIHEDTVHLKKTTFKCDYCEKGFATIYRLQNHIKNVHERRPTPKTHICETCGRAFATKQQVLRHQPVHTGERAFSCELCSATFRQSAALYTHRKLVHLNANKAK